MLMKNRLKIMSSIAAMLMYGAALRKAGVARACR